MNNGTVWQIMKNLFLLLEHLRDLFALNETSLLDLDPLVIADIDDGWNDYNQDQVIYEYCVVLEVNVNRLERTIEH
jgi:hypothetical protein